MQKELVITRLIISLSFPGALQRLPCFQYTQIFHIEIAIPSLLMSALHYTMDSVVGSGGEVFPPGKLQHLLDVFNITCKILARLKEQQQLKEHREALETLNKQCNAVAWHLGEICQPLGSNKRNLKRSADARSAPDKTCSQIVVSKPAKSARAILGAVVALKPEGQDGGDDERALRALRRRWHALESRAASPRERQYFISSCFTFLNPVNLVQAKKLIEDLEALESTWDTTKNLIVPHDSPASSESNENPPNTLAYVVSPTLHAAQAIYKALASSDGCNLSRGHDFGATIRLGNYHNHGSDGLGANPGEVQLGINMFFSVNEVWQEVGVHFQHDFEQAGAEPPAKRSRRGKETPRQVEHRDLCVLKIKANKSICCQFRFLRDKLFHMDSITASDVDLTRRPVSLRFLLQSGTSRPKLTDWTKCILAVLVSYGVLNLHDTPWLQQRWNSDHIVFCHTKRSFSGQSTLPLTPFLKLEVSVGLGGPSDTENHDETGQLPIGTLGYSHPYSNIITLAIILLEIQFGMTFPALAERYVKADPGDINPDNEHVFVKGVYEACSPYIAEGGFKSALSSCLNDELWVAPDDESRGAGFDDNHVRTTIHEKIVSPLESEVGRFKDLAYRLKKTPLDEYVRQETITDIVCDWMHSNETIRDHEQGMRSSCSTNSSTSQMLPHVEKSWAPTKSLRLLSPDRSTSFLTAQMNDQLPTPKLIRSSLVSIRGVPTKSKPYDDEDFEGEPYKE